MTSVIFITSNEYKFQHAQHKLTDFAINLERRHLDLEELQSESGEYITRHKAEQAYKEFGHPVVVNDDTWSIPGLGGFPGAYMKSVNDWFSSEDWLRLTKPLKDRRVILQQHVVYQDAGVQQHFVENIVFQLIPEIRGQHKFSHLPLITLDDGKTTSAERVSQGMNAVDNDIPTAWQLFGSWYKSSHSTLS